MPVKKKDMKKAGQSYSLTLLCFSICGKKPVKPSSLSVNTMQTWDINLLCNWHAPQSVMEPTLKMKALTLFDSNTADQYYTLLGFQPRLRYFAL